jgi:hypothetical protein
MGCSIEVIQRVRPPLPSALGGVILLRLEEGKEPPADAVHELEGQGGRHLSVGIPGGQRDPKTEPVGVTQEPVADVLAQGADGLARSDALCLEGRDRRRNGGGPRGWGAGHVPVEHMVERAGIGIAIGEGSAKFPYRTQGGDQ